MHAVVVLLDRVHAHSVEQLWEELEARFGVRRVQEVPLPHLSLQGFRSYDPERMVFGLERLASRHAFRVHAHGYGFFSGQTDECLTLHVPLVRTEELSALHGAVRGELTCAGQATDGFYEPQNWSPHVTIADRDLTPRLLGEIAHWLATRPHHSWTIGIDNLSLVHDDGVARTLRHQVRLKRGERAG